MIVYNFFANRLGMGLDGLWVKIFLFTLFVIIPTIICVRQVKQPNQRNVKIILGILGFCLSYIAVLGWYFLQGLWADAPDTKQCPYCSGKILISAKKCKHCGEWIDKNASNTTSGLA